jgi:hypothetical protein
MMMAAAQRVKNALASLVFPMLPLEKLAHRRIVRDADFFIGDLECEMQIANHPTNPYGVRSFPQSTIRNPKFEHRLSFLRNDVNARFGFKKSRAVFERVVKIKAEFRTIRGYATPASLRQRRSLHEQFDVREKGIGFGNAVVNQLHGTNVRRKFKKGNTVAPLAAILPVRR